MQKNNFKKISNYDLLIENELKTDKFFSYLVNNKIKLDVFLRLLFNKFLNKQNKYININKKSLLINCYF